MSKIGTVTKTITKGAWVHSKRTLIYGFAASVVFSSFAQGGDLGKNIAKARTSYIAPVSNVGGLVIAATVGGISDGASKVKASFGDDKADKGAKDGSK